MKCHFFVKIPKNVTIINVTLFHVKPTKCHIILNKIPKLSQTYRMYVTYMHVCHCQSSHCISEWICIWETLC